MDNKKKFTGITSAQLKWIAVVLMFLNHFCYERQFILGAQDYFTTTASWYLTRISFMIFAFQISEGMHYTHDRKKYILFLFLFALLSEIPFDLCFSNTIFNAYYQNVFFTLGLGALAIYGIDHFKEKPLFQYISVLAACITAVILQTDYNCLGVATIVSFYYFRDNKKKQLLFTSIIFIIFTFIDYLINWDVNSWEMFRIIVSASSFWEDNFLEWHALLLMPLLHFYHGEKGKNINKWFFYCFYPGHLLLIYGIMKLVLLMHQ